MGIEGQQQNVGAEAYSRQAFDENQEKLAVAHNNVRSETENLVPGQKVQESEGLTAALHERSPLLEKRESLLNDAFEQAKDEDAQIEYAKQQRLTEDAQRVEALRVEVKQGIETVSTQEQGNSGKKETAFNAQVEKPRAGLGAEFAQLGREMESIGRRAGSDYHAQLLNEKHDSNKEAQRKLGGIIAMTGGAVVAGGVATMAAGGVGSSLAVLGGGIALFGGWAVVLGGGALYLGKKMYDYLKEDKAAKEYMEKGGKSEKIVGIGSY